MKLLTKGFPNFSLSLCSALQSQTAFQSDSPRSIKRADSFNRFSLFAFISGYCRCHNLKNMVPTFLALWDGSLVPAKLQFITVYFPNYNNVNKPTYVNYTNLGVQKPSR